jgi:hypothetical protein
MWRCCIFVLLEPLFLTQIVLPTIVILEIFGSSLCDFDFLGLMKLFFVAGFYAVDDPTRVMQSTLLHFPHRVVQPIWTSCWFLLLMGLLFLERVDPFNLKVKL